MSNITEQTHDLVARIQYSGGCTHDIDVSQFMDVFIVDGEEAVKHLVEDDQTYCFYVRPEEKGTWQML